MEEGQLCNGRKGIQSVKKLDVGLFFDGDDLTGALHVL